MEWGWPRLLPFLVEPRTTAWRQGVVFGCGSKIRTRDPRDRKYPSFVYKITQFTHAAWSGRALSLSESSQPKTQCGILCQHNTAAKCLSAVASQRDCHYRLRLFTILAAIAHIIHCRHRIHFLSISHIASDSLYRFNRAFIATRLAPTVYHGCYPDNGFAESHGLCRASHGTTIRTPYFASMLQWYITIHNLYVCTCMQPCETCANRNGLHRLKTC